MPEDCRLARGVGGVWRYYEVTSQGNTSIGEGTLRTTGNDMPEEGVRAGFRLSWTDQKLS